MEIDLTKCVFGDRLKTRGGEDALYLDCHEWDGYRHRVTVAQEDGEYYVRDDGLFTYSREHSADIVEILPRDTEWHKLMALRQMISDDSFAMTFQTMGQYRSALLKAIKEIAGKGG